MNAITYCSPYLSSSLRLLYFLCFPLTLRNFTNDSNNLLTHSTFSGEILPKFYNILPHKDLRMNMVFREDSTVGFSLSTRLIWTWAHSFKTQHLNHSRASFHSSVDAWLPQYFSKINSSIKNNIWLLNHL